MLLHYKICCSRCGRYKGDTYQINAKLLKITDDTVMELFLRQDDPTCGPCNAYKVVVYGPDPRTLARVLKYRARKFTFSFKQQQGRCTTNLTVKAIGIDDVVQWLIATNKSWDYVKGLVFHPTNGETFSNIFEPRGEGHQTKVSRDMRAALRCSWAIQTESMVVWRWPL
jgi:hypothetical protein